MNEIVQYNGLNLDELQRTAKMMVASGYFDASRDAHQAIAQIAVKIMAGKELGYGPFASVQGIHVIQGKPAVSANLMAAAVKGHPHYDYKIRCMSNDKVAIEFFEDSQPAGVSEFTAQDAVTAGLTGKDMYKKFPRNMLFARALSNGVRWYCPDVFSGNVVYVPEELGAETDGDGAVIVTSESHPVAISTTNGYKPEPQDYPTVAEIEATESITLDDVAEANNNHANPFNDPTAGVSAEANVDYGALADRLSGNCKQLADWALGLHRNGDGPASKAQYGYLTKTIDEHTGNGHTLVLSVLCRRHVTSAEPCSKTLAAKLLDLILKQVPQKDEHNQSVKGGDGKVIYVDNPKYRADVVECIKGIAAM
jgi:hypothetical protein